MTRDDIIKMAREAGFNPVTFMGAGFELFERFAAPVAETLDGTAPCAAVWCEPKRSYIMEPFNDDPCAATRRAIVKAAAAIGGEE
jgi:hypothetical protein